MGMANKLTHDEIERANIRRRNLDLAIGDPGKRGRIREFAETYDLNESYISQILGGHRLLGDKAARRFEKTIGLKPFYLDQVNPLDPLPGGGTPALRADQIELLAAFELADPEVQASVLKLLERLAGLKGGAQ